MTAATAHALQKDNCKNTFIRKPRVQKIIQQEALYSGLMLYGSKRQYNRGWIDESAQHSYTHTTQNKAY